ncbi:MULTISPECIES: DUF3781 domain-containing protein [Lactiplantibacillus]|uniref:DUF3781 domain-containing protein n=1 Tax=Lactiplantibacillus TaxID=2767842 RepID=UPI0007C116FB|nr:MULTISPECIES: DUF3781 domain-containing protein [Lactiplantibacillus]KZU43096.1 hypothetical protein Nizo2766_2379 [Lactiplantibacillus plantarum]KZU48590.1 hypothetical protein Nizo2757_0101 [Lactiplantibacillus plantarum]MDO7805792.1 DUF3781 domain-containing protein [Lactiplantibacillus pentosus]
MVFERVNKKLGLNQNESATKLMVNNILSKSDDVSRQYQVELTINASNYRLITASKYQ